MSTDVSSVVKHFPSAENGFTTTTSGSVSSGAATVGLNSVSGYSNGEIVVFIIDPSDVTKKQTFTGIMDTGGSQVTNVVWTSGTNQAHALGATVVDYVDATHISMVTKGLLVDHYQEGYHKTLHDTNGNEWIKQTATTSAVNEFTIANAATGNSPVISATGDDTDVGITLTPKGAGAVTLTKRADGWITGLTAPTAVAYNGNRSYSLTYAASIAAFKSPGMRGRTTRTVAAPNQCTDLESGSSQYYSKSSPAGMTFTDDFTVSAWIKLESYGATMVIASRYNGTSGWEFALDSSGRVFLNGYNGGASNISGVNSYQSIPLGKWVHIAAQLDMSAFTATTTTSYVMIDGLDVPATVTRGGTNPTALIQAGNLEIGSRNGGTSPFDGKIAQVAIYSAKVTQANVKATISQKLSGSETSLISGYSFNNSIADLNTSNANDLTAQNSAAATNADSPFGGQAGGTISTTLDYYITTAVSSDGLTETVQVPEGCTIPTTGGVTSLAYSTDRSPYGFPAQRNKWAVEMIVGSSVSTSGTSTATIYNPGGLNLNVPIGEWVLEYQMGFQVTSNASGIEVYTSLSTANNDIMAETAAFTTRNLIALATASNPHILSNYKVANITTAAATPYYVLLESNSAFTALQIRGTFSAAEPERSAVTAFNAYL